MKINVGTYNIWHAQDYAAHLKGERRISPENIAEHIFKNNIAICGLEEVESSHRRSDFIKTPELLAEILSEKSGERYYHAYAVSLDEWHHPGSKYGNAIISRYPITSTRTVKIDVGMGVTDVYEPRIMLIAELDVDGKPLTAIVTHLGLMESERILAAERLEDLVKEINTPIILMGDLNTTPGSYVYNRIAELLRDSSSDKTLPLTHPSENPKYKIDYIFGSRDLTFTDPRTDSVMYSDHLPLTVTLDW